MAVKPAGFQKGRAKTGGRVKGTPNKDSKEVRSRLKEFIEENFDEAIKTWRMIPEPDKKLKAYIELTAFVLPKLQAVQADLNVSKVSTIESDLIALSEE